MRDSEFDKKSSDLVVYGDNEFDAFYREEDIKKRYDEDKRSKRSIYQKAIEDIEEKYKKKSNKLLHQHNSALNVLKEVFKKGAAVLQEQVSANLWRVEKIDSLLEEQKNNEELERLRGALFNSQEDSNAKDALIQELSKRYKDLLVASSSREGVEEDLKKRVLMSLGMEVANLQNKESQESQLCNILLSRTFVELLGAFGWSFNKKANKKASKKGGEAYPSYFIEVVEGKLACKVAAAINLASASQLLLYEKYKKLLEEAKFLDPKPIIKR